MRPCSLVTLCALGLAQAGCADLLAIEERTLARCEAGVARCTERGREVCDAEGAAFALTPCSPDAPLCRADGACVSCDDGARRCTAAGRERCTLGAWQPEPCPADTLCDKDGACFGCALGEGRCVNGARERCAGDRSGFIPDACPGETPLCSGPGACVLCEPGDSRCTHEGREICAPDGSGFVLASCDQDDTCIDSLFTGAGDGFSCVVTVCGSAYCWGRNERNQVDDSSDLNVPLPRKRALPTLVRAGTSGLAHSCVLDVFGDVYCWGDNIGGQSDGVGVSPDPISEPTLIPLETEADRVVAGTYHTCAILKDGRVQCFGDPTFFKLGGGGTDFSPPPVKDTNDVDLTGVIDVAGDRISTCAVTQAGALFCWGALEHRDYFDGGTFRAADFAYPMLEAGVSDVEGGWFSRLAIGPAGLLGEGLSTCGALGFEADVTGFFIPIELPGASAPTLGQTHACAVRAGVAFCWGDDRYGQLGVGSNCLDVAGNSEAIPPVCGAIALAPIAVELPAPVHQLVARYSHTCALVNDGEELVPYCWGEGLGGALGDGSSQCSVVPVAVAWPPGGAR